MRTLVVEDEFVCRHLLTALLTPYGICDVAINGKEAITAVAYGLDNNEPYDLICLDVLMPELDGQETLKQIREIESQHEVHSGDGAKVVMTSALSDAKNIMEAFKGQCEAYLVKPIEKAKLMEELKKLGLI